MYEPSTMPSPDRRIGTSARSAGSIPCVSYSTPSGVLSWVTYQLALCCEVELVCRLGLPFPLLSASVHQRMPPQRGLRLSRARELLFRGGSWCGSAAGRALPGGRGGWRCGCWRGGALCRCRRVLGVGMGGGEEWMR